MSPAIIAAAIGLASTVLDGYRLGRQWKTMQWAGRVAHLSILALLAALTAAFVDVAIAGLPMLWRQWLVAATLAGVAGGHVGLLWRDRADRRRLT